MLIIRKDKIRKKIHLILSSLNLFIALILIFISFLISRQEKFFNIYFASNQYLMMGIISLFQIVFSIFVKYTSEDYPYDYIFDAFSLLIFFSLIGMVISINFLSLVSFYILALLMIGMIFYLGEFKKEFNLLKPYFIACCISIFLLSSASLILYYDAQTTTNNLVSILIIIGFGIPCGLFPFYIFHLKIYFRETNFSQFVLYMCFNYVSTFIIMRLLKTMDLLESINIFIVLIISGLGVVIAIYYIILELFTSQDGYTYSIKKVLGYSTACDSNLILLFFTSYYLFPKPFGNNLIILLLFLYTCLVIIKLLSVYSFVQVAHKSYDDNIRFLGNFWKDFKIYGIFLFLTGLFLIFLVGFVFTYSIFIYLDLALPLLNSLISLVSTIAITLYIITILIVLLYTSHFFIQIYISEKVSYLERDSSYKSTINIVGIYLIEIILIAVLIGNVIIYIYNPNYYIIT